MQAGPQIVSVAGTAQTHRLENRTLREGILNALRPKCRHSTHGLPRSFTRFCRACEEIFDRIR